jgi:hypothetical protein
VTVTRKFIDSDGVNWQVYELTGDVAPKQLSGEDADSWLYFFSRDATRSLASYPDDWAMMDWPGLERLCHTARPPAHRNPQKPAGIARGVAF